MQGEPSETVEMGREARGEAVGILLYARHFILLACVVAVLAATNRSRTLGAIASFGIYGALHSSMVAVTLSAPQPLWRKLLFVAIGSCLSMLSVAVSFYASRLIGRPAGMAGSALLLAVSSGLGAASYTVLVQRYFAARLARRALLRITLGCVAATLAVLASGIYMRGGGLWFAAPWWLSFSAGLWYHDLGRSRE
ncbi:MAG: hypothetical protein M3N97_02340 [Pseudomonadota bacterium]|nr:hypothetical protein [Pseudomonadota bacterium]